MHNMYEQFCKERQYELLKIANTEIGRFLLASLTDRKTTQKITKIVPNAYHEYLGYWDHEHHYAAHFFSGAYVLQQLFPILEKMEIASEYKPLKDFDRAVEHFAGVKNDPSLPHIFLASLTLNPSAGDGWARGHNGGTWAQTRSGLDNGNPGGFSVNLDYTTSPDYALFNTESDRFYCYRGYFPFVTSSLPDAATITAATFRAYVTGKSSTNSMSVGLIQTTQASMTAVATADFSALTLDTPTEGATRVTIAGLSTSAYMTLTLNSSGRGWISKTGNTKLGLRGSGDIDNSAPANDSGDYIQVNFSESGSNKPELVVTYSVPGMLQSSEI